ncbi:MAG: YncE family protein [Bacteroidota bacterium]
MKKLHLFFLVGLIGFYNGAQAQIPASGYKVLKTISVPGTGSWDYLTVDKAAQRLFISHGTLVDVVDLKSEKVAGQVLHTAGVHGIALVPSLNKGFITAGRLDSVVIFDMKTLKTIDKVTTGKNPDAILYDPFNNRIFTFNGRGNSVTAIDAGTNQAEGTIDLSGKPEYAVSDGKGKIFCNIEDKSTVVKFDARTLKVEAEWSLAPGKEPTGLAFDVKNQRLFSACSESQEVVVMDAVTGKIVANLPIGAGCDGIIFIPAIRHILTSNGRDGTITVIAQKSADNYQVIQTLPTRKSARTITYDDTTGKIYLSSGEVVEENGKRQVVPGTFQILVVGK